MVHLGGSTAEGIAAFQKKQLQEILDRLAPEPERIFQLMRTLRRDRFNKSASQTVRNNAKIKELRQRISRGDLIPLVALNTGFNLASIGIIIKTDSVGNSTFVKLLPHPTDEPVIVTKLTESMKDEEPTSTELSALVKAQMVKSMTLPATEIISIRGVN